MKADSSSQQAASPFATPSRKAMSDLPLDKENQRRNVSQTPGLPSSHKVVPGRGTATAVASTPTSTNTTTTTANDAALFAAMRSPPGSSKVLRKRWKMQFETQQAERQQQQPRLLEKGPIRLTASSPNPIMMVTSSSDADLVNTTCDSDQSESLGFSIEPVSARKNCTNPVAMTLLHSDDGMEDVTFLLQHDREMSTPTPTTAARSSSSTRHSGSRHSPLTCSARVPVQNIARPVAERPTVAQPPPKQQFYQHDHQQHDQQQHDHQQQQQQYYYQQQQEQQQQEPYYQQQQQRPYGQYQYQYQF